MCIHRVLLSLLVLLAVGVPRAGAAPPNIVYFLVDDLGAADCGFSGGKEIKTPHIDALASQGCRFDSFYVQPLCSSTRAALMTGRYPMRHGLQVGVVRPWANYGLPLAEKTLADDLQAAGYATGLFGKWHLGHCTPDYLPLARGFTKQYGHYNGAIDYFTHRRDGGLDWHEDQQPLVEEGYSTDLIARHAAQFVRDHAGQQPFFLYVPFNAVHSPYEPPRGGGDAYPHLTGVRRDYAAMLTSADKAIDKIVHAVQEAGVRDNTLFIFSSDNGGPQPGRVTDNGKLRGGKGQVYEGGVRVAAFATWDGHIAAGSSTDEPMHIVDWRPTLEKLCDAQAANDLPLDGRDIWPTLTAGAPSPHEAILLNSAPREGAIRVGDWKLIVRRNGPRKRAAGKPGGETIELYDLGNDRSETTNLASERPEKVDELRAALREYARQAVPPKGGPRPPSFKTPKVWGDFGG